MSILRTNNIQPYSGDTFTISGSFVDVPGVLTVETSITSSGDLRFPNMGTGVVNPVTNVSASGTSSLNINSISTTNTTTFLDYGVNVISYSTGEDYCVKLPLIPTKGKELTIVNASGIPIHIFPGVEGGSINGIVGGDAILPSDGIAYKFVCWENPLPGGWSIVSTSPSTVTQSDVISLLISQSTLSTPSSDNSHAIVSNNIYALGGSGFFGTTTVSNELLTGANPLHGAQIGSPTSVYPVISWITPDPNVKNINKITVYTNLTSSYGGAATPDPLNLFVQYNYNIRPYAAGTTTPENLSPSNFTSAAFTTFQTDVIDPFLANLTLPFPSGPAIAGGYHWSNIGGTVQYVPGTFIPADPNYIPISSYDWTGYLSTNPGDPGTTYYTADISSWDNFSGGYYILGKGLGISYIGTVNIPFIGGGGSTSLDYYFMSNMGLSFSLDKRAYIDGLKLKIVIDYVPY